MEKMSKGTIVAYTYLPTYNQKYSFGEKGKTKISKDIVFRKYLHRSKHVQINLLGRDVGGP